MFATFHFGGDCTRSGIAQHTRPKILNCLIEESLRQRSLARGTPALTALYRRRPGRTQHAGRSSPTMSRRARAVPFARMRPGSHLRNLANLPVEEWPKHLRMAHSILVDELKLQDDSAWEVLQSSLNAAHACAQGINQRARDVFQIRNRERLRKIFNRIARCAKRMPSFRRHAIDRKVSTQLRRAVIDSESLSMPISKPSATDSQRSTHRRRMPR